MRTQNTSAMLRVRTGVTRLLQKHFSLPTPPPPMYRHSSSLWWKTTEILPQTIRSLKRNFTVFQHHLYACLVTSCTMGVPQTNPAILHLPSPLPKVKKGGRVAGSLISYPVMSCQSTLQGCCCHGCLSSLRISKVGQALAMISTAT